MSIARETLREFSSLPPGILHGVHWGLGHGSGELLGGFLISTFGASPTFAIFGAFSLVIMAAYIIVNKLTTDLDQQPDGYSKLESKPPEERESENDRVI